MLCVIVIRLQSNNQFSHGLARVECECAACVQQFVVDCVCPLLFDELYSSVTSSLLLFLANVAVSSFDLVAETVELSLLSVSILCFSIACCIEFRRRKAERHKDISHLTVPSTLWNSSQHLVASLSHQTLLPYRRIEQRYKQIIHIPLIRTQHSLTHDHSGTVISCVSITHRCCAQ